MLMSVTEQRHWRKETSISSSAGNHVPRGQWLEMYFKRFMEVVDVIGSSLFVFPGFTITANSEFIKC